MKKNQQETFINDTKVYTANLFSTLYRTENQFIISYSHYNILIDYKFINIFKHLYLLSLVCDGIVRWEHTYMK